MKKEEKKVINLLDILMIPVNAISKILSMLGIPIWIQMTGTAIVIIMIIGIIVKNAFDWR